MRTTEHWDVEKDMADLARLNRELAQLDDPEYIDHRVREVFPDIDDKRTAIECCLRECMMALYIR